MCCGSLTGLTILNSKGIALRSVSKTVVSIVLRLTLSAAAAIPLPTSALELDGERFSESIQLASQRLVLRGAFTYDYLLWSVYSAALYAPAALQSADILGESAKRLELVYKRDVDKADFIRAAEAMLERNLSSDALAKLQPQLSQLHKAYVSVTAGDRYALSYIPGRGTELRFNGKFLLIVPGAAFARAYFGVWLGQQPLDEALRDALLGQAAQ